MTLAVHTLAHAAEQIGLLAGIVIGLGVLGKAAWGAWKMIRKVVRLVEQVEEIYRQFQPNAGHSLSDRILRIDENVQTNSRNIATVYAVVLSERSVDPGKAPLLETLRFEPEQS